MLNFHSTDVARATNKEKNYVNRLSIVFDILNAYAVPPNIWLYFDSPYIKCKYNKKYIVCKICKNVETIHTTEKHYNDVTKKRHGVPNHQPYNCLLNRSFRCRSQKTSKHRVTCICVGNSPVTGEFPAQRSSKAVSFSFHDAIMNTKGIWQNINTSHIKIQMMVWIVLF